MIPILLYDRDEKAIKQAHIVDSDAKKARVDSIISDADIRISNLAVFLEELSSKKLHLEGFNAKST